MAYWYEWIEPETGSRPVGRDDHEVGVREAVQECDHGVHEGVQDCEHGVHEGVQDCEHCVHGGACGAWTLGTPNDQAVSYLKRDQSRRGWSA